MGRCKVWGSTLGRLKKDNNNDKLMTVAFATIGLFFFMLVIFSTPRQAKKLSWLASLTGEGFAMFFFCVQHINSFFSNF